MPTKSTPPPTAPELGHLYINLHSRVRRLVDDAMTAGGVSLSRSMLLKTLAARGPMNQSAIATEFGFAPRSITDLVDGLERDGLAERVDNPDDRRSRLVRITDSGSVALKTAMHIKQDVFEQIFATLEPTARAELYELLQSVYTALSPQPGETSCPLTPPRLTAAPRHRPKQPPQPSAPSATVG